MIIREVALRTGAAAGLLAVAGNGGRSVDVVCAWGAEELPDQGQLPAAGIVGRALDTGRPAVGPIDPVDDHALIAAAGVTLSHAAVAPIRLPASPAGALAIGLPAEPQDQALVLWLLEGYAWLASLCLHDHGTLDGMLAAARLDGLTGCLNHAAIVGELDREIRRAHRHGGAVSCCFIDLDGFKQINDRYGHPRGSRLLADVAATLRREIRYEDSLGRYGGDEFLALLPDTEEAAACSLARRLVAALGAVQPNGEDAPLGASIGVAQCQPGAGPEETLEAADQALRAAKASGGRTVIAASALENAAAPDVDRRVTSPADTQDEARVVFCAYCGHRSGPATAQRVCVSCQAGLLVWAPAGSAPEPGEPFLTVDAQMTVCSVSRDAEELLGVTEPFAVDRHIDMLLRQGWRASPNIENLYHVLAEAASGESAPRHLEVRVAGTPGARLNARVVGCGPSRAALIVLTRIG